VSSYVHGRSPAPIVGSNTTGGMVVCLLCVLSERVLCDELITGLEGPTNCGGSLCVITKHLERGHSPRWAAELEKIIIMIIIRIIIIIIIWMDGWIDR
jgi:hypothetical protein